VIASRDSEKAFHYVDPPYIDMNQGHYKGYTREDFQRLLETLSNLKGKFLLSSYSSDILTEYSMKNNWFTKVIEKPLAAYKAETGCKRRKRVEVLTANYQI